MRKRFNALPLETMSLSRRLQQFDSYACGYWPYIPETSTSCAVTYCVDCGYVCEPPRGAAYRLLKRCRRCTDLKQWQMQVEYLAAHVERLERETWRREPSLIPVLPFALGGSSVVPERPPLPKGPGMGGSHWRACHEPGCLKGALTGSQFCAKDDPSLKALEPKPKPKKKKAPRHLTTGADIPTVDSSERKPREGNA